MVSADVMSTREWEMRDAREKAEKEAQRNIKRRRLKLSPELADGDHFAIVTDPKVDLSEFLHGGEVGWRGTVEIVEMTDAEVEALPDI